MPPDVNCTIKVLPLEMFIERFVSRVESVKLRSQLLTTTCCATVSVVTKYGLERVGVYKKNLDRTKVMNGTLLQLASVRL